MKADDLDTNPSDCPPDGAEPAQGDVFRCCKSNPPGQADMLTAHESRRLPDADPCLRRALSVFTEQRDAEHQARLFRRWKKRFVSKATLGGAHGHAMPTSGRQPSHTSWWPAENVDPAARAALFTTVVEVEP